MSNCFDIHQGIYKKQAYTFCPINVSYDKKSLYIPASESGTIDWLELSTCQKIGSLGPNSTTRGMLMNLKVIDENYLIAGYESGEIALIDCRAFQHVSDLNLFSGDPLMCFDYVKSKNFGVAGSPENVVKEFCIETDSPALATTKSLTITNPGLNCVKIRSQDCKLFACGGWDAKIRVYSVKKSNLLVVLDFHKESINCIDFSASNLMAAGSNDGIISFWNLYN
jgi:WD40 repeat protein